MVPFTVTFIGNKEVLHRDAVLEALVEKLEQIFFSPKLIPKGMYPVFYFGGYGQFSEVASEAIDILRKRYPKVKTKKLFITPYITPSYQKKLERIKDSYDEIVYPPLENVPLRYAIVRRNRWMIDQSFILITYMRDICGNTRQCVEYAKRKYKIILHIEEGEEGAALKFLSLVEDGDNKRRPKNFYKFLKKT